MLGMWHIGDVGCCGFGMLGMWDVGDMRCWGMRGSQHPKQVLKISNIFKGDI